MADNEFQKIDERLDKIERLVLAGTKDVLTFRECMAYTGYTKNQLYKLTSKRKIPFYKPMGKSIYFCKAEVHDWLLRNRHATEAEIKSKATTYVVTHRH
jgi:prophage regulatory protein